jgi:hypothetical protein
MKYYYWLIATYKNSYCSIFIDTYKNQQTAIRAAEKMYIKFPGLIKRVLVLKSISNTDPYRNEEVLLSLQTN